MSSFTERNTVEQMVPHMTRGLSQSGSVNSCGKKQSMADILYKELSYAVIGAAMEVHGILGPGYLETVYQAALAHEMHLRGIQAEQFKQLPVSYKGVVIGNYQADIVVEDKIILEIKAVSRLLPRHRAQALNYLTATGLRLALLLNFGADSLQRERVVR